MSLSWVGNNSKSKRTLTPISQTQLNPGEVRNELAPKSWTGLILGG